MILFLTRAAVHVVLVTAISPTITPIVAIVILALLTFGNIKKVAMG